MKPRLHRRCARRLSALSQGGLSLVELLIAMVLSLIVVAAISEFFVNVSRSSQEMAKTNSQIENARFALEFLRDDIMHAGYWAGFLPHFDDLSYLATPSDAPDLVPDPCLTYANWDEPDWANPADDETRYHYAIMGIPIQVHSEEDASWSCGSLLNDKVADTDILIVRHANTCAAGDTNCEAVVAGDLYFQVPNCIDDLESTDAPYLMDPNEPSLNLTQRDCTARQAPRKFIQTMYFIRDWTNTVGDEAPSLVRSRLQFGDGSLKHQDAEVLVEGIERFRVELGIDDTPQSGGTIDYDAQLDWGDDLNWTTPTNRGDGIPDDDFVYCDTGCTFAQLRDVVAVRLYLLARANSPTQGYVDTKNYVMGAVTVLASALEDDYKRHVFSTTVKLNNVSGRRETPFDPNEVTP